MQEITFKGTPLTLVGRQLHVGATAPEFNVSSQDLKEIHLRDFEGKVKILTSFPSIDTPVCDLQVKEFNTKASKLSKDVVIVGISKDLPFAQKRFCQSFEIKNIHVVSDYKTSSFGINYGLLIKELSLLARSVLIVDKNNIVRYIQIVKELTMPADYPAALAQLEAILTSPVMPRQEESPIQCSPCKTGTPPLPRGKIGSLLISSPGWVSLEDKKIVKEFKFTDFSEAKYFLDLVSVVAEEQGHHPTFTLSYNKLKITLTTHAAGGLTENDFIMAKHINELNPLP